MTPTAQRVRADRIENFIAEMDVYGLVWMVTRGEYVNGCERFSSRDELLYFFRLVLVQLYMFSPAQSHGDSLPVKTC